jgi:DNA-binding response OmpR family regulator
VVDDNAELLSLLVQHLEKAGYLVLGAKRGKQAIDLSRKGQPALAIVDILLPDMTGYSLVDALRKERRNLPVIFITGVFKAGRHALEAKQKYGSIGYFEKPFEADQLLEAVNKVLPSPEPRPATSEEPFKVEMDVDFEEEGPPPDPMELTGRIKVTGADHQSTEISGRNLTAKPLAKGEATVVRAPSNTSIMPSAAAPALSQPPLQNRSGDLKDNLPSLINAFHLSRETGELGVQREKVKKVIYFEKGQPVFALSNLVSDRFGQFLVRVGKIKANQLDDALKLAASTKRRTGDVLVDKGLLEHTERLYYVGQQVKAIIYTLFGWEEGSYVVNLTDRPSAEPIKLDVHPALLIRRGIKKLYKPERLRRLLSPEDLLTPSLQPAYQLHEIQLEDWEAKLLPKVDGMRSVAELITLTGRPEPLVYSFLYSLVALTFLDRRP